MQISTASSGVRHASRAFLVLERQLRDTPAMATTSRSCLRKLSRFLGVGATAQRRCACQLQGGVFNINVHLASFPKITSTASVGKNESPELMLWRKESHSSTKPDQVPRKAILAKFHGPFFFELFCRCKGLGFETFTGFLGGSARVLRRKFDTRSFAKFHKLFFSNFLLQRVWATHLRIFLQKVQSPASTRDLCKVS